MKHLKNFATADDIAYLPMIICFVLFFINDLYGFFNWRRMKRLQTALSSVL